jgi:hypothetical protein
MLSTEFKTQHRKKKKKGSILLGKMLMENGEKSLHKLSYLISLGKHSLLLLLF